MSEAQQNKLLSICITSYNRIDELIRCIRSVDTKYSNLIEIVVSEDHSEKCEQIRTEVAHLQRIMAPEIRFNSNGKNLGYDRNLQKLISLALGKYILFISDDDSFKEQSLDEYINLLQVNEYNMIFTPFILEQQIKRYYSNPLLIDKGIVSTKRYIYDAILFSGLLFRKELIESISGDRFLNCNYFQVYLFMYMMFHYDTNYINIPLIICHGDGENAFGKVASSDKNDLLSDRQSVFSNLEFHKGLIRVIRIFEEDFKVSIIPDFSREYCLRAFSGMALARAQGLRVYQAYWKRLKSLKIPFSSVIYFYHTILLIFGAKISSLLIFLPRKILLLTREKV